MPLKYYITGTRRGLGKELKKYFYHTVDTLEECDIFINCKHDGFNQVKLLYDAVELGKRVISIGSNASSAPFVTWDDVELKKYQVYKTALDNANSQLFYAGNNVTNVKFGMFESPSVEHIEIEKMSLQYCRNVIVWIIEQPHRIKSITVSI